MYAPTFRGGSQSIKRTINVDDTSLDYDVLINALEKRFGGKWYVFLRLHPQLVARNMLSNDKNERLIDVSKVDDMYEILAGCDAFITDYSSAAFDAAVMKIPVFIYADDYKPVLDSLTEKMQAQAEAMEYEEAAISDDAE